MKLTVSQIRKNGHRGPVEFEDVVDVSELETMNNDIRRIDPAQVKVSFTVDGDELIASLRIKGKMVLPCARTLVDVPYEFDISVDEVFSTSPYLTDDDLESEIHPVEGEVLDLKPYIMENILLDTPYRVFSKEPNPEGAAPTEGEGWSFVQEQTDEKPIDPRLKKLASLLENNEEENE